MKMHRFIFGFIKTKAVFEIFLMITLIFFIGLSGAKEVKASDNNLETCCTLANNGEFCVSGTTQDKCKEGFTDKTTCENVPKCKNLGCCFANGMCSADTTQISCESSNGVFSKGTDCENLAQCKKGCCTVGTQCFLSSAAECDAKKGTIDDSVNDDLACMNICKKDNLGCCTDDCKQKTMKECSSTDNFFNGAFCSKVDKCSSECKSHVKQDCGVDQSIRWFDSCGNEEEVVDKCNPAGIGGSTSTCALDNDGKPFCKSWDCATTWDNPVVEGDGVPRKHGESWCEYQAAVGPTMDLPGTRHYIHHCLKGEEVVEPLEEDRSRICMYGDIDLGNGEKRMASFAAPNNANGCGPCKNEICCKKAGSCIWNSDTGTSTSQDKDKINSSIKIAWLDGEFIKLDKGNNVGDEDPKQDWFSVSCSNGEYIRLDFKDHLTKEETKEGKPYQEYNFKFQTSKDAGVCKFSVYDNDGCQTCDFYSYDTDDLAKASENKGICIPIVPPGNSASCEAGTKSLKEVAYWEEECIGTDWSCEGGCDVYNEDSKRGTNTICGAYGDCGAKFNLAESFSNTGFIRDCDPNDRGYSNIGDACPDGSNRIDPAPDKTNISWNTFVNAGKGLYIGSLDTFIRSVASDNKLSGLTNEQIGAITLGATIAAFFTAIIITAAVMVGSLFTFGQALNVLLIFVLSLSMSGPWGWVISIGVLLAMAITAILLAICKDDEKRDVTFVCKKWEPPQNSNDCHKCNEMQKDGGVLPNDPKLVYDYPKAVKDDPDMYGEYTPYQCTKALCESLGYCQFEDKTVDGPRCLELEPTTIPVKIKFDDVKSTCNDKEPGEVGGCNVDSSTDNLLTISGQLQEFSELNITLKTIDDKGKEIMATCAYTPNFKEAYADLALNFAEKDLLAYKHTLAIANVQQNKSFSLQVFCKGTNSPAMISPFVIKFESAPEPDLTPPEIKSYDPPLGKAFVTAGTTEKEVTLYLNEQVTSLGGCRFSNESGKDYYNMSRMMSCSTGGLAENPSCTGRLTGLISGEDNKFYFRCKDMAGNVQKTDWPQTEDGSMPYIVRASPPLNITNIKCTHFESDDCSETIYDESINLTIDTIGGVNDDGIATCSYGLFSGIYTLFNKTGTNNHFQPDINPGKGKHILYISCGDEAGNKVLQEVPLTFDIDNQAPQIISIYDDSGYIKIKTDEKCDCKYQNTYEQFNYNNATLMDSPDGKEHSFINQNIAVNVMCMDRFGNLNGPFNVYAVDKTTS